MISLGMSRVTRRRKHAMNTGKVHIWGAGIHNWGNEVDGLGPTEGKNTLRII